MGPEWKATYIDRYINIYIYRWFEVIMGQGRTQL